MNKNYFHICYDNLISKVSCNNNSRQNYHESDNIEHSIQDSLQKAKIAKLMFAR